MHILRVLFQIFQRASPATNPLCLASLQPTSTTNTLFKTQEIISHFGIIRVQLYQVQHPVKDRIQCYTDIILGFLSYAYCKQALILVKVKYVKIMLEQDGKRGIQNNTELQP